MLLALWSDQAKYWMHQLHRGSLELSERRLVDELAAEKRAHQDAIERLRQLRAQADTYCEWFLCCSGVAR